jgi:hypothetical protein
MSTVPQDDLEQVEIELRRWLETTGYASWDPYDGLACAAPWSLVRRSRLAARLWTQVVKGSPLNLRPWVGIRPRLLSRSLSDLASAALLRHRAGLDPGALDQAHDLLRRLRAEALPGWSGACWALATPYVTRYIDARGNDPNLFWTLGAATTFLEAWDLERRDEDLALARSAVDFISKDLGWVDEGEAGVWFRYFAGQDATVYNVAALTGAFLQRVARCTGEAELGELGGRALRFVVRHQNADGSWFYARGPQGRWVDGFHTGYILEALLRAVHVEGDTALEAALRRGVDFYVRSLFAPDDVPRYAADRLYPLDVQNCAQAIQTLAKLSALEGEHLQRAERVARAVVARLYRRTRNGPEAMGFFIASRGRWTSNRLPYVRWGEAPMLRAHATLLAARRGVWA